VADEQGAQWTIDEAVQWLDPPISRRQLADLIGTLRVQSRGTRPRPMGRPAYVYDSAEIMRLHSAVVEWLLPERSSSARRTDSDAV